MKIINRSKIPDALFRYLKMDLYDHAEKGDSLSVTEILNPTQVVVLKRRYAKKITIDAIDRLWVMLGNGVHRLLEDEEGMEKIERLKVKVEGREVSGKWDRIFDNEITDYKVTSSWTIAYGSREMEWHKQLSMYRWLYWKVKNVLLKETGYIVALLRDWSEKNVGKGNYPDQPAVQIEFDLMSMDEVERIVTRRVQEITKAEKLKDDKLPECTAEERWEDERTGVSKRCAKYCDVNKFCVQFKKVKK